MSSSRPARLLSTLTPLLYPYRWRIALALGLLLLASTALLLVPLAFRDLIDEGMGSAGEQLNQHFLWLIVLALFWAFTVAARYYTVSWVGDRVTADLRSQVYQRVIQQSPQFFETLKTGEVLSRLTGDTTLIQTVVGSSASMGLRSMIQFIGGMVMLAVTSWSLFALNLGLMLLVTLPVMIIGRKVKRLSRESQDRIADSSAMAGEILNAMPTVQSYTQEGNEAARFKQRIEVSFKTAVARIRIRALMAAVVIAGISSAIVFVLWVGARQVSQGSLSSGEFASFILYAGLVASSVSTMAEVWGDIMRAAGAAGRLLELLQAEAQIEDPAQPSHIPQPEQASIQLDNVSFHYPANPGRTAIDQLSIEILPGETVALVGPSGAGKSTMFQLLLRFYDITSGSLKINGVDIRALSLAELRGMMAIVPQEPVIFSANALENIRYGRPDASDAEVIAAARAALVAPFIERLPEGYQTFLGERGTRLSGGERQRIAIARAMLKNAPILLLDEATSALDTEAETLVQRGLEAAMQGRTTLVIAHRLATVQNADRILVLDQGRIVEHGTPAELSRKGGLYSRLASQQFGLHGLGTDHSHAPQSDIRH